MPNPANDIFKQANQGSVAAIIQVLNERLADVGIRTRAILADGVLQLLCEAPTAEQMEASTLVDRIRHILEAIGPRNIRRVNINSRIVREQQLLWLDEISRDPVGQVLWSQEITLKQPSLWRRLQQRQLHKADTVLTYPTKSRRQVREQRQLWRGVLVGGATVAGLLLLGWLLYPKLVTTSADQPAPKPPAPAAASRTVSAPTSAAPTSAAPTSAAPTSAARSGDAFANAVWLAEQASQEGVTATTSAQWLDLAARWQKASDLMSSVASTDARYQTAQSRVEMYRKNREAALQKAQP